MAADASFFWECVKKHAEGKDIRGASGHTVTARDAATLFGGASPPPAIGLNFDQYDQIPVERSGAGTSEEDVPQLGQDFSMQSAAAASARGEGRRRRWAAAKSAAWAAAGSAAVGGAAAGAAVGAAGGGGAAAGSVVCEVRA